METGHLCDFYVLDAILHKSKTASGAKWSSLADKAQALQDELVPKLSEAIYAYLFLASMGEARHAHDNIAKTFYSPDLPFIGNGNSSARQLCYKQGKQFDVKASQPGLKQIFGQEWHGHGIGGENWYNIADAIEMYWTKPPGFFIDHVADLHHNNGTAFSKETSTVINFQTNTFAGRITKFLQWKTHHNILGSADAGVFMRLTPDVNKLWSTAYRELHPEGSAPYIETAQDWAWEPVKWGDKVLRVHQKWEPWFEITESQGNNAPMEMVDAAMKYLFAPYIPAVLLDMVTPEEAQSLLEVFDAITFKDVMKEAQPIWANFRPYDPDLDKYVKAHMGDLNGITSKLKAKLKKKEVVTGTGKKATTKAKKSKIETSVVYSDTLV